MFGADPVSDQEDENDMQLPASLDVKAFVDDFDGIENDTKHAEASAVPS